MTVNVFRQRMNQLFQGGRDHPLWEILCFNQMLKGFCQKYRPQPKKVEKNRWGSKLLAGMKPNQKKKGTSPGQLKLFWDELDITNKEIVKAATIFVKANCYTPNPKNKLYELARFR
ncbi:hypothetical protein [Cylindrospermopsis raciborskii]|uniref:hypothetical protein n=1 Tax=Cylindrospermopsis raciborskii TaxID=77022 RepID=UPI0015E846B9|nr:hypothetical protein [Cylindrospermopsis raciborskii]